MMDFILKMMHFKLKTMDFARAAAMNKDNVCAKAPPPTRISIEMAACSVLFSIERAAISVETRSKLVIPGISD